MVALDRRERSDRVDRGAVGAALGCSGTHKARIFILITTFKVRDGQAARVVESRRRYAEEQATRMRGVVGTSVHVCVDGTTVVNDVQWETRVAFDAMFESPAAKEHMRELDAFILSVSPVVYDVVYVGKASS